MDLFEAIESRCSYRGPMRDEPVSRVDLARIVQAGIQAPSGYNAQTTRFVVVDDPEMLQSLAAIDPQCGVLQRARAVIACVAPRGPQSAQAAAGDGRLFFGVEDCAAATQNMLLAVTALGYGSVWLDGWLRQQGHDDTVGALLGVPADSVVRVLLPLGRPMNEHPQNPKHPWDQRAWFNRYGG